MTWPDRAPDQSSVLYRVQVYVTLPEDGRPASETVVLRDAVRQPPDARPNDHGTESDRRFMQAIHRGWRRTA